MAGELHVLVQLLLLLQLHGRITAGELASALEVSVRTVYRDLEALAAAGMPAVQRAGPQRRRAPAAGRPPRVSAAGETEARAAALYT